MLIRDAFFWFILLITFLRAIVKRFRGNFNTNYLFVSMFVVATPFDIQWPIKQLAQDTIIRGRHATPSLGMFGNSINLNAAFIFALILVVCGFYKLKKESFSFNSNRWLYAVILLCAISYFNPLNLFHTAIFPLLVTLLQFIFLFKLFESNFDRATILRGVFDGLVILTLINLALCICYPILKMDFVTNFVYGKKAFLNTLRRAGYPATIGIFPHPNTFGFFSIIPVVFFISCYLRKYANSALVIFLIAANLLLCFFTFSRSSYLGIFISVIVLIFMHQRNVAKGALNPKLVLGAVIFLLAGGVLFWYLATYQNLQLFGNLDAMLNAREEHWTLGYEIWKKSPFIGVGANEHVYYMAHTDFGYTGAANAFTVNVAIHNIHFIVLTETGLIGSILWLMFLFFKIKSVAHFEQEGDASTKILNMTCLSILIALIITGFTDTSPFASTTVPLILFIGYFATDSKPIEKISKGAR